jgi:hypothetical protein
VCQHSHGNIYNIYRNIHLYILYKMNPELRAGGDGLITVDLSDLRELLVRYPHVKFLVTLLSKTNQHEACVLANKFRNLHLYGKCV